LRGAEGDAAIQPPAEPAPTTRPIADVQLPHLDWSSLGPDQQLGQLLIPVTRTRLVRYAGASGDFNPIHHSDFAAHALGLDSVIAHGMWTMGAALRVVTDTFSAGQLTSCQTRFTKPVPVPDDGVGSVLEVGAAVSAIEESGAKLAITAECRGVRVLSATRAEVSRP
jgi:acyl dehydratase